MTSATDKLRTLLDERGVEYRVSATGYSIDIGPNVTAYANRTDTTLDVSLRGFTPEQAVAATLGPAYEPPIAAHWDGDVLVLTTPRDPSSVHVQRAEGQPRKVYPSEATLVAVTCRPVISDNLAASEGTGDAWADCSECGHLLYVLTDPNSQPPNYCPNCGRRVVA